MIYFDNAATAPISERVRNSIARIYSEYGFNPSSLHGRGRNACEALRRARRTVADVFSCDPDGIYFTSGATEAANILIQGFSNKLIRLGSARNEIIVSEIEHASVFQTAESLKRYGWTVKLARVDRQGKVSPEELIRLLGPKTAMVCMMTVNNEIGSIQDIAALASVTKNESSDILFVTDAVQSAGKISVSYDFTKVDAFFASGHKFGGPKGCGFFYLNPEVRLEPILFGGSQEKGYRPGTTDVCAAHLLAEALLDRSRDLMKNFHHVSILNQSLTSRLTQKGIPVSRTVPLKASSPYILSLSLFGYPAKQAVEDFSVREICISSGSACSSRSAVRSRILQALKIPVSQIDSTIRISFSSENTLEEVQRFTEIASELCFAQSSIGEEYAVL